MTFKFNKQLIFTGIIAFSILLAFTNCEREISDEAVLATYPNTPDIYTDNPVGLTDIFFHSDNPADGANPTAFNVDNNEAYAGSRSIRLDVPDPGNPNGGYVGGVFIDRGNGRNLTQYDALTFYIKASRTVASGVTFGFGSDYTASNPQDVNKYRVTTSNISLSTNWEKVIIPIPDPSVLTQLKGLFALAAGTQATGGEGYIIWIDEIRFEKLGNISLVYPYIFEGQDNVVDGFLGSTQNITGTGALFNLANGSNIRVDAQHTYFNFSSSDPTVNGPFELSPQGNLFTTINGLTGSTVITATLNNSQAQGSLTINAVGDFVNAPNPTQDPANVISIFSDTYSTIPGFNPGVFAGPNTINISLNSISNNQHLKYQGIDYVGIGWDGIINASSKTYIHLDVQLISGSNVIVELKDFGANGVDGGGDDSAGGRNISSQLLTGQWVGIDIPLNGFTLPTGGGGAGNPNKNNLGFVIFVSNNGATFLVDNIYFY
ncbi:hypothetical protein [Flavobacterium sp.]|uniref:hypothetical protein n=1 Tax=Flavobacterium sp. TaxID=239 RepID=UPI003528BAC6